MLGRALGSLQFVGAWGRRFASKLYSNDVKEASSWDPKQMYVFFLTVGEC